MQHISGRLKVWIEVVSIVVTVAILGVFLRAAGRSGLTASPTVASHESTTAAADYPAVSPDNEALHCLTIHGIRPGLSRAEVQRILNPAAWHAKINYVGGQVEDVSCDVLECDGWTIGTNTNGNLVQRVLGPGVLEATACGPCSYRFTSYPAFKLTMCTTTCGENRYSLHRTRTSDIETVPAQ